MRDVLRAEPHRGKPFLIERDVHDLRLLSPIHPNVVVVRVFRELRHDLFSEFLRLLRRAPRDAKHHGMICRRPRLKELNAALHLGKFTVEFVLYLLRQRRARCAVLCDDDELRGVIAVGLRVNGEDEARRILPNIIAVVFHLIRALF